MNNKKDVLSSLKESTKGKIRYDRHWMETGSIKEVIEECVSPPVLSAGTSPGQSVTKSAHKPRRHTLSPGKLAASASVGETAAMSASSSLLVSTKCLAVEKSLRQAESETSRKARLEAENRRRQYDAHTALLLQQAQSQLYELYFRMESQAEQQERSIRAQEKEQEVELRKQHLKLKEHHRQHHRILDEKFREANKKQKEEEEEKKKIAAERERGVSELSAMQAEVSALHARAAAALASCTHPQYLCDATRRSPQLIMQVHDKVSAELSAATSGGSAVVDLGEVSRRSMLAVEQAVKVLQLLQNQVAEANKKGKEETDKEQKAKQEAETKKKEEADKKRKEEEAAKNKPKPGEVQCITAEALTWYEDLQAKLKETEKSYADLVNDNTQKKFRFALQKAVNTPVNAVAPTSGAHLRDKLQRLLHLLQGQSVDAGSQRVSASTHPGAANFCKDLLARKLVKQGDEQVSSQHEAAFAMAAVAVGVWCEHADFGHLLLAHFHTKCPYLVPYYLPQAPGQTKEDYYRALGYNFESDGTVEKQDKFLRRMSGLTRLYAALLVSAPPRRGAPHPHGVEHGWRWLCRVMSLQPRPYITATVVYDFLEVAGFALMAAYGRQFIKLLRAFIADYLPRIEAASPAGAGGPLTRLKAFLEKVVATGKIAAPAGLLPQDFWFR